MLLYILKIILGGLFTYYGVSFLGDLKKWLELKIKKSKNADLYEIVQRVVNGIEQEFKNDIPAIKKGKALNLVREETQHNDSGLKKVENIIESVVFEMNKNKKKAVPVKNLKTKTKKTEK